jgi:asparagine synthase (glutamine-hydrolysing)
MCGIVGIYGQSGSVHSDALRKATSALFHRGPDGQKQWISPDGRVGLGHARLSIIDLEGGHQPLSNEDGSIRAVVNGEIYDFERIRQELLASGHRLATSSDSEVLIHLYEDLGVDALHQLRGEFAFILWDGRAGRLLAGRDRFGIKPLFYAMHQGSLYLASEAKALFVAGVPAAWDSESLYCSMQGAVPLQGRSLFKGVYQVPPGHVMIANGQHLQTYKYWDFNYPKMDAMGELKTDAEYIERFRELFDESVRLRLRADVPVGVYLSGGLDSCAILGTARKLQGQGIKAFTLSFQQAEYDELSVAQEMARFTGAELQAVPVTQKALAQNFAAAVRHGETLMFNAHGVAKFMLSKVVRDAGLKVVLTGEGSDEILAGYPHFRRDLLLYSNDHGQGENVEQALAELVRKNSVSKGMLHTDGQVALDNPIIRRLGFVPSWIEAQMNLLKSLDDCLAPDFVAGQSGFNLGHWFLNDYDLPRQLTGRHPVNQSLYLWSKSMLPNYLLTILGDRMEMGNSIEGRVPFLDHHLVEFVTKLPISLKIRGMTEKYILREAVRPVLTKTVYERQKHPFVSPPSGGEKSDPFADYLKEYIGDHLSGSKIFKREKVETLFTNLKSTNSEERQASDLFMLMIGSVVSMSEQFGLEI